MPISIDITSIMQNKLKNPHHLFSHVIRLVLSICHLIWSKMPSKYAIHRWLVNWDHNSFFLVTKHCILPLLLSFQSRVKTRLDGRHISYTRHIIGHAGHEIDVLFTILTVENALLIMWHQLDVSKWNEVSYRIRRRKMHIVSSGFSDTKYTDTTG